MNYTEMNIPLDDHPSSYALLHYNDGDKETQAEYISNQEEAELRYDAVCKESENVYLYKLLNFQEKK